MGNQEELHAIPDGTTSDERLHDDSEPSETEEHLQGFRMYCVTVSLLMAIFLTTLDASIISTAVPQISARFHSTLDIGWYSSIYMMAM